MTVFQKVIKYLALAFAVFLTVSILGGILSVLGLFGGIFTDAVSEDLQTYTVSSEITSLDISVNAAGLCIKQGEQFSVESNLEHLTVKEKDGTLLLRETTKFARTYNGAVLTLYVPAGTVFQSAAVQTGAGKLDIGTLSAGKIRLELGAGEVIIGSLTADLDADIDGGAGKITISGGSLHDLDLDMGVGQLNLTSALTGESELDLGVGESNLTLLGDQDDYRIDVEKGLGSVTVDGETVSGLNSFGGGQNRVEINGGVGSIHLNFKKTDAG